jgi:3',5'-cyclic AMP phosphodiesterase CpdA
MKVAHISDLHLLALDGVPIHRFLNKRISGWANLRLKRASKHRSGYVKAIITELARRDVDHVVVTGDLTNLALEGEFELARDLIGKSLGFDPSRVTVVPGNHDIYTRGARDSRRFETYFGAWLKSDLPELSVDVAGARFPVVKLRGSLAIVGLSSAVPRLPFVAAGEIGSAQIRALAQIVKHPEVTKRRLLVALHHPMVDDWSRMKRHVEGLRDASKLLELLLPLGNGLVVHGHLHRRVQRAIGGGTMKQVGATSASLDDESPDRMAGFNLYELGSDGSFSVVAHVYRPHTGSFDVTSVPDARVLS